VGRIKLWLAKQNQVNGMPNERIDQIDPSSCAGEFTDMVKRNGGNCSPFECLSDGNCLGHLCRKEYVLCLSLTLLVEGIAPLDSHAGASFVAASK
jgi:hypothetical protein